MIWHIGRGCAAGVKFRGRGRRRAWMSVKLSRIRPACSRRLSSMSV